MRETYQHAIISMLVEQQHARLQTDGNCFLGRLSVVRVEDGLAPDAPLGGRSEIDENGPGCSGLSRWRCGCECYVVGIVVCEREGVSV